MKYKLQTVILRWRLIKQDTILYNWFLSTITIFWHIQIWRNQKVPNPVRKPDETVSSLPWVSIYLIVVFDVWGWALSAWTLSFFPLVSGKPLPSFWSFSHPFTSINIVWRISKLYLCFFPISLGRISSPQKNWKKTEI